MRARTLSPGQVRGTKITKPSNLATPLPPWEREAMVTDILSSIDGGVDKFAWFKEKTYLPMGTDSAVRAVNGIFAHVVAKICADCSGGRLLWVCCAHNVSIFCHSILTLKNHN